jgi:hypothetical protein
MWLEGLWRVRSSPKERRLKVRPQTGQPRGGRLAAGFAARRSVWRWRLSLDVVGNLGFKLAEVLIGGIEEAGAPGVRGDGPAGGRPRPDVRRARPTRRLRRPCSHGPVGEAAAVTRTFMLIRLRWLTL